MPTSQQHVSPSTPMGLTLVTGGATLRVWAPRARQVFICGDFNGYVRGDSSLLVRNGDGRWTGFVPGVAEGDRYKFYVVGEGSEGFKRDPYARELIGASLDYDRAA